MPNVRGNSFKTINRWITSRLTESEYDAFLKTMSDGISHTLTAAESRLWYPLTHLTSIYEHIVEVMGKGRKELLEDLGTYIAEVDLGGILKPLISFVSIPRAISRAPFFWPRYDDSGEFKVISIEKGAKRAVLELQDYEGGPLHCVIIQSWLKKACQLLGGKNVRVREKVCRWKNGGNSCRWELIWE